MLRNKKECFKVFIYDNFTLKRCLDEIFEQQLYLDKTYHYANKKILNN